MEPNKYTHHTHVGLFDIQTMDHLIAFACDRRVSVQDALEAAKKERLVSPTDAFRLGEDLRADAATKDEWEGFDFSADNSADARAAKGVCTLGGDCESCQ
jgi:hypothetical protein